MTRLLILAVALALAMLAKAAVAQDCEHVDAMQDRLLAVQDKRLGYSGLVRGGGAYLEIWINPRTGEWAVLAIHPNHVACLAAEGDGWQDWWSEPPGVPG